MTGVWQGRPDRIYRKRVRGQVSVPGRERSSASGLCGEQVLITDERLMIIDCENNDDK